jgi:hypothetical protein
MAAFLGGLASRAKKTAISGDRGRFYAAAENRLKLERDGPLPLPLLELQPNTLPCT